MLSALKTLPNDLMWPAPIVYSVSVKAVIRYVMAPECEVPRYDQDLQIRNTPAHDLNVTMSSDCCGYIIVSRSMQGGLAGGRVLLHEGKEVNTTASIRS